MPALRIAYRDLGGLVRSVGQLTWYAVVFVCAFVSSRAKTAATVVALRSQLADRIDRVQEKKEPKARFTPASRILWVVVSRFPDGWEDLAQLMRPATFHCWHHRGYRLWRRWESRQRGRPALGQEMQALIRKLSRENPLWSAGRIRDTTVPIEGPPEIDCPTRLGPIPTDAGQASPICTVRRRPRLVHR